MKPVLINQAPALGNTDEQGPLRPGLLVADAYRLGEQLGSGSMGSVWRAQHLVLGHGVAIKFLHASLETYPQGRIRFEREGKLAARLGETCRHICRVTEFGVLSTGTPFVVMELLQGEELAQRLKRERVLPLSLVADIVAQLCRALLVAHRAGVIHRDLKPANVFLCAAEDGQGVFVKLLDFGVAHASLEDGDTEGTRAGVVFGTLGYTSPEQISGEAIDNRSDLWSVAVIAYRMATGRTPFGAGSLREVGLRILTIDPPAPSSIQPALPPAFDAWIKKALAKQREERFATAIELADALLEASTALQRPSGVIPSWRGSRASPSDVPQRTLWRGRSLLVALAVLGVLALLASWALVPNHARVPPLAPRRAAFQKPPPGPVARPEPPRTAEPALAPQAPALEPMQAAPPAPVLEVPSRASATRRVPETTPSTPAPDALKARAEELWNKTDEL